MATVPQIPDELLADSTTSGNDGSAARRESPQSAPASGARTYGDQNVDLPEELQNALLRLIQTAQAQDLYQRRIEVLRDRRNRFYERGLQHVYEDVRTGMFILGTPGALVPDPNGDGYIQCGQYLNDYNIFGRALQIIIAKLSENAPGVDFQPDSADNNADLQAAAAAEGYRILFDRRNESKDLITAIVRMMGVSGRTITWTRTLADEQKYGTDENGQPRRVQITTTYGTLESKVPIMAKCQSEWPYCLITEDPHLFLAKAEHPLFADKITEQGENSTADTQFERMARIGALQGQSASFQITDTYNWYVERKYAWFRPSMFWDDCLKTSYTDPDNPAKVNPVTQQWTLRDALMEAFPDGCQATFIGETYVGSRNISMDDELSVDFPYAGDGMSRPAIMDPAVVIQDDFNDDQNNYHEVKVTGWPSTWIDSEWNDISTINDQQAAPYCFRALKDRMLREGKMADRFFREPNPEIPQSFMAHTEYMATQLLQFILAIPSAVQGAGMPDQKTKGGYQEAVYQAMGQLGVIFGAVQRLMANVYRQAALAAARDAEGTPDAKPIVIPGPKGQSLTISLSDLGKGRFMCHPDVDSGYPESTIQKRATLANVLQLCATNPMIAQAVFQSPDNWDFFARTMGIPEITLPEAKARRKQLAEIEILLQQAPMAPDPEEVQTAMEQHAHATMMAKAGGGAPPPPFDANALLHSSIPPEESDFHPWEAEECQEFLSDWPKVQAEMNRGNQQGIQNVRLHWKEHVQMAAAMAPPPVVMPPRGLPAPPPQQQEQPPAIQ